MKKQKFLLFLFLIISIISQLFPQTIFSKVIDGVNSNEYGIELEYYHGNYYTVSKGVIVDTILQSSIISDFLLVTDSLLNRENKFVLRKYFKSHSLILENDTLYLQGTDHIASNRDTLKWNMYRFTLEGDSIDLHSYANFNNMRVGWYKTFIKDNYIISGGATNKNDLGGSEIVILKMSKSGNLVKENRFFGFANPNYINDFGDLTPTIDDNFAMAILYFGVPWEQDTTIRTSTEYIAICKFDSDLDTIWTRQVSNSWLGIRSVNGRPKVTRTVDGGVVVATSLNILDSIRGYDSKEYYEDMVEYPLLFYKYNKDGDVEWTDTIFDYREPGKGAGPIKTILEMKTARNGDIIGCGKYKNIYDEPQNQAWVFRYSPDGKLKWQHTYIDREYYAYYSLFYDIEEAENGDIICFGGLKTDSIGEWYNTDYSWLLRVDSNGCYTPGCKLADTLTKVLTDIEDLTTEGLARRIEIYPNPASSDITIRLPEDIKWKKWSIYNVEGQKVKNGAIDRGLHTPNINIQGIGKGIHFMMVKSAKGRVGIGKFVVE